MSGKVITMAEAIRRFVPDGSTVALGVSLERVSHRYGGVTAVDDVSLAIEPGELVALLGPSGCGKTTLLRCLVGAQQVRSGSVEVLGEPAGSKMQPDPLRPDDRGDQPLVRRRSLCRVTAKPRLHG